MIAPSSETSESPTRTSFKRTNRSLRTSETVVSEASPMTDACNCRARPGSITVAKAEQRIALFRSLFRGRENIQQRQPKDYERAVILLMDLHDLAVRQEDETGFQLTMEELRKTHAAKGAFLRRLAKANL
jgi:hypothetical protein